MAGFLLDTNVISELTKSSPYPAVIAFLDDEADLWIPVIAVHELCYGLARLPQGRRRHTLESTIAAFVEEYEERVLPLDQQAARCAGELRAQAERLGQVLDVGDALIAGTAKANDLALATRNNADFGYLDLPLTNPWAPPARE